MTTFSEKTVGVDDLNVSRETKDRLTTFVSIFEKWSATINLVAASTKKELWSRHIADSLQIYEFLPGPKQWVDLGSGAGFPGIITAILLAEQEGGWVHLVESNHKKASFLRQALLETGARGSVHCCRIEDAPARIETCDAISARALAELDQLLEYALPWAKHQPALRAFFHKGRDYETEVAKARGRWRFDMVLHRSAIEMDSVILEISNIAPKVQP